MAADGQLGFTFQTFDRRVWTVKGLLAAARTQLEREYTDVWVEGEISNYRPADSGHLYFTLKDNEAQLRVVVFRSQARLLRFRPENGMQIVARGRVTIYEARGEMQLSAEYLEPKGAGALQIAFEQLKARLEAEGLFEASRKKPIPPLPRRIGIVTSPQAAALRDILNILQRRHRGADVLIYPAQVQGEFAPGEVGAGIRYFNRARSVDVIIVARGGGSAEDLASFNHEGLARTVSISEIPVISAIGHETDVTILDFVADLRAPTPSAAAELVIRSRHEIEEQEQSLQHRLEKAIRYRLLIARQDLADKAQHRALAQMTDVIRRGQQRVDDLSFRLIHAQRGWLDNLCRRFDTLAASVKHYDLRVRLKGMRGELQSHTALLGSAMRAGLAQRKSRVELFSDHLQALSPVAILDRGYALVFDSSGKLLKDANKVEVGDEITARLARGELKASVKQKSGE
jgi:exodeoxyribonuclease VII large subunit